MQALLILALVLFVGCAPYRIPTTAFEHDFCMHPERIDNQSQALRHHLYKAIPRHRCQIRWYDAGHWLTWALFGNDDDGLFGEEAGYRLDKKNSNSKALAWGLRNPLHNFCFYVIGSAHRQNSGLTLLELSPGYLRTLCYTPQATTVFPSKCSCFYLALHGGKPFVSLRLVYDRTHRSDFYFGWRERGNFGIKFQPLITSRSGKYLGKSSNENDPEAVHPYLHR